MKLMAIELTLCLYSKLYIKSLWNSSSFLCFLSHQEPQINIFKLLRRHLEFPPAGDHTGYCGRVCLGEGV